MRRRELRALVAVGALAGCVPSTAPLPSARKLPAAFEGAAGGESIARLGWHEYFGDERLARLIDQALEANLDLRVALQRIDTTRASVQRARGALLPRIDVVAGAGLRRYGRYTMDGAGNATTDITPGQVVPNPYPDFSLGVEASWEVDLWGRLRNQRDAAVAQVLGTREAANLVTSNLVAGVASTWFGLRAADRAHEVVSSLAARQAQVVELVKAQRDAGRVRETAVLQLEAQVAGTSAQKIAIAQQRTELENGLNLLLGRPPQPIERAGELRLEPARAVAAGVPADLLRNRPDVRAAELAVAVAAFDVGAARAAFFPSLTIGGSVGLQAFNPAYLISPESLGFSLLGGLVAPIVNRAAIESDFRAADSRQREALYEYQKTTLTAFVEASNALANIKRAEQLLLAKDEQRAALKKAAEQGVILFQAGKATWLEVLLAQQQELVVELEWIEAWRLHRVAQVQLYKALGGGWRVTAAGPR